MSHGVVHWEISGRDLDLLSDFYRELFDWEPNDHDENYRLITPDEGVGGGLMRTRGDTPSGVLVYVSVDDLPATLAEAQHLGAEVLVPPTDVAGVGAFAVFRDPAGNAMGLLRLDRPDEP